jgi:predicted secreted protein
MKCGLQVYEYCPQSVRMDWSESLLWLAVRIRPTDVPSTAPREPRQLLSCLGDRGRLCVEPTPMHAATFLKSVARLLIVVGVAAWTSAQELVLTEQDDGKIVGTVLGQSILLNLRGNASTGYTWMLISTNGDSVVPTGPVVYTPDAGGGPGNPGTFSFPFRAAHLGETTLNLAYLTPWDPMNVDQSFTVTIRVSADTSGPQLSIALVGNNRVITWRQAGSDGFFLEGKRTTSK